MKHAIFIYISFHFVLYTYTGLYFWNFKTFTFLAAFALYPITKMSPIFPKYFTCCRSNWIGVYISFNFLCCVGVGSVPIMILFFVYLKRVRNEYMSYYTGHSSTNLYKKCLTFNSFYTWKFSKIFLIIEHG